MSEQLRHFLIAGRQQMIFEFLARYRKAGPGKVWLGLPKRGKGLNCRVASSRADSAPPLRGERGRQVDKLISSLMLIAALMLAAVMYVAFGGWRWVDIATWFSVGVCFMLWLVSVTAGTCLHRKWSEWSKPFTSMAGTSDYQNRTCQRCGYIQQRRIGEAPELITRKSRYATEA